MRRSGRTTRMLQRAKELHEANQPVVIVAADSAQATELRRQLGEDTLKTPIVSAMVFDWPRNTIPGYPVNTHFLIDHFAREQRVKYLDERIAKLRQEILALEAEEQDHLRKMDEWISLTKKLGSEP